MAAHGAQQGQLCERLEATINHFRSEYDCTYLDVVGALEMVKLKIFAEACEIADEEGEEDYDKDFGID